MDSITRKTPVQYTKILSYIVIKPFLLSPITTLLLGIVSFPIPAKAQTISPSPTPIIMDVRAVRQWQAQGGITRTLRPGMRGTDVGLLQELLSNYTLVLKNTSPTGTFGSKTAVALKEFQKKMGLPQTGTTPKQTRDIINAIYFQDICPDTPWNPDDDKSLENVNRQNGVGLSYQPGDLQKIPSTIRTSGIMCLRSDVIPRLKAMFVDAQKSGHTLMVTSAFRRPEVQTSLYAYWTSLSGEDAKRGIAEAGHSEHQLGTTVDLTAKSIGYSGVSEKLGKTKEGIWLKENSYKYGFIMSYPEGKEAVTGYRYEPWHFRYVGIDTAKDIYDEGMTIKEYFDTFLGNDF